METMIIDYLSLKSITCMHSEEIHTAVSNVIDSGWYLQGKATADFEQQYANYIGTKHCIGCGNGLDALTLYSKPTRNLAFLKMVTRLLFQLILILHLYSQ